MPLIWSREGAPLALAMGFYMPGAFFCAMSSSSEELEESSIMLIFLAPIGLAAIGLGAIGLGAIGFDAGFWDIGFFPAAAAFAMGISSEEEESSMGYSIFLAPISLAPIGLGAIGLGAIGLGAMGFLGADMSFFSEHLQS